MTNDVARLPAHLRKRVRDELQRGERVLYAARPSAGSAFAGQIFVLLFAVFWCGITFPIAFMSWAHLLGIAPAFKGPAPTGGMAWFVEIFLIPFVLVGLGLLAAVVYAVIRSFATVHAVTGARILNIYGGQWPGAESYDGSKLNSTKRRDAAKGHGSLQINYGCERDSEGDISALTTDWRQVPDVRRAEAAVLELIRRSRSR